MVSNFFAKDIHQQENQLPNGGMMTKKEFGGLVVSMCPSWCKILAEEEDSQDGSHPSLPNTAIYSYQYTVEDTQIYCTLHAITFDPTKSDKTKISFQRN